MHQHAPPGADSKNSGHRPVEFFRQVGREAHPTAAEGDRAPRDLVVPHQRGFHAIAPNDRDGRSPFTPPARQRPSKTWRDDLRVVRLSPRASAALSINTPTSKPPPPSRKRRSAPESSADTEVSPPIGTKGSRRAREGLFFASPRDQEGSGCPCRLNLQPFGSFAALSRGFCQSRIGVFARTIPDPTSGSLLMESTGIRSPPARQRPSKNNW